MLRIEGLIWDEEAEEHIGQHHISIDEVEEAVKNGAEDRRYLKRHRGYLVMISQTDGGRYLTVVLDEEGDGFWYPVTARDATPSERTLLKTNVGARR